MSTRIRLQRHGRKGRAFFHIVVADQRAKRDGRFIEKLGIYNPNTNPATIDLDFDRAAHWVKSGAEPSDTARAILSYKGVMMYDHLMRGVTKGALTEDQAKAKFEQWMESKTSKIEGKKDTLAKARETEEQERLERERKIKESRIKAEEPEAEETEEGVAEAAAEVVEEAGEAVKEAAEDVVEKAQEVAEEVKEAVSGDDNKEEKSESGEGAEEEKKEEEEEKKKD